MSDTGCPAHPRAVRPARGRLERPIGAFADPSPQALVPFCRQLRIQGLCPSTRAILARLAAIPDAPFGGGPVLSRPAHRPRTTRRQLRGPPRQATTPGQPSLRALTRVPSCATRARRAIPTTPAGSGGSAFLLTSGSVLLLSTNHGSLIDFSGFSLFSPSKPHTRGQGTFPVRAQAWRARGKSTLSPLSPGTAGVGVPNSSATFCRWCWRAWECTWYNHSRQGSRTPTSRAGLASRKRLYVPKMQSLGKVWRSFGSPTPDKAVWGHSPDVPVWREGDPPDEREGLDGPHGCS